MLQALSFVTHMIKTVEGVIRGLSREISALFLCQLAIN